MNRSNVVEQVSLQLGWGGTIQLCTRLGNDDLLHLHLAAFQ